MATTPSKNPTPAPKPAAAPKPEEQTTLDYLQHALEDLNNAREHAQQDVRTHIDSAVGRIQEVTKELAEELRKRAPRRGD